MPKANGLSSGEVSTQIFEVSSEFVEARNLRLSALGTGTESLVMNPVDAKRLRNNLEAARGIIRSAPRIMSLSGREGTISINTGDPEHNSQLSCVPTHAGGTIHLTLLAQFGPSPAPKDEVPSDPAPVWSK